MIKAEIIADSINSKGCRLTSYILEYPRFIHAELMTHRVFSRNEASSRAIPIEKMIQQVIDNPAMPIWWGKNQSGMQAKEELDDAQKIWNVHKAVRSGQFEHIHKIQVSTKEAAKLAWLEARDNAINHVKKLNEIGLHKQIANRILEPWFNIRVILSGTEFENFFALRVHPDAQPEIQELARQMLELYNTSKPKQLKAGEWHIPFGDRIDEKRLSDLLIKPAMISVEDGERWNKQFNDLKIKIAIARCARVSYFNYDGKDDYQADIKLCDRLFGQIPRHLSPTEHVAQALDSDELIGNFRGFKQYRKFFVDENLKDGRVKRK
jgi:thymidylate synthase ThyX